jgi:hypothetical protein
MAKGNIFSVDVALCHYISPFHLWCFHQRGGAEHYRRSHLKVDLWLIW